MVDSYSVPRRSYDFEDYIDILRRNIPWLIAPAFIGLVIATVVAFSQEDVYVSRASIRVQPQQISERLIPTFTTQDVADRVNSMTQTVLSRQVLTGLIQNLGLYKKELTKMPMEDVIDEMHKHISIRLGEGVAAAGRTLPSMEIYFSSPDRSTAQKVTQELVSQFMNLSTQAINDNTQASYSFVEDEAKQAKVKLDEAEKKLSDFRAQFAYRLPDDVQMNLQQLNALSGQLGSYNNQLNQINERRMYLDSQMGMARDRLSAVRNPDLINHNDEVNSLNRQIHDMELSILQMKDRYTDDYPDLESARDRLAFLKKQRDQVAKEKVATTETKYDPTNATPERMSAENTIESLKVQGKALDLEERNIRHEMGNVNNAIHQIQARLDQTPGGEKPYTDLLRDRDLAKQSYLEAENRREFATQQMHLDARKQGQTLEVIDTASLPTSPSAPKRGTMLPVGFVAGLAIGVVIVAIREFKDTSLKNLKDARMYTQLNILGSVPLLENDVVVQRRKQVMWASWAAGTLAGLLVIAGSVAHYYWGRG